MKKIVDVSLWVPLFNPVFLSNFWEYHHKSYIAKNQIPWTTFL